MERTIYLYLEFSGDALSGASLNMLCQAQRLFPGAALTALVGRALPEDAARLPVADVFFGGEDYSPFAEPLARAVAGLPLPDLLLAPMSAEGRAFAAAYAAYTGLPLVTEVLELYPSADKLTVKRAIAANRALAKAELTYPQVLLVHTATGGADALPPYPEAAPRLTMLPQAEDIATARLERRYTASRQEMELEEAAIVVAGGAGLQTAAGFQRLQELCALLNAPLGGSRVAEDKGWIAHRQMIGATGRTIAPKLYLCFGVSGAVQHSVGIRGSEHIIAVNTDPTAEIFNEADLAAEGDASAVLAELTAILAAYKPAEGGAST